ncbi:unnamed protein product [marine sediment metagenome]|uniref:Uncharacterized protein n=1 Tax=marine sediment metagenome TaxID=412755 RepID=X1GZP7_9ZZZZ
MLEFVGYKRFFRSPTERTPAKMTMISLDSDLASEVVADKPGSGAAMEKVPGSLSAFSSIEMLISFSYG